MSQWTNNDGLTIRYGAEQKGYDVATPAATYTSGLFRQLVVDFSYDNLPLDNVDSDNDGTNDAFVAAKIPANAYITRAILIVEEDWATADAAVLNLGLYTEAGAAISATGIDAAIAAAALDTGDVVVCDGTLAGGGVTIGTADGYIGATITVGSFTTGKARLIVEYADTGTYVAP